MMISMTDELDEWSMILLMTQNDDDVDDWMRENERWLRRNK